MRFTPTERAYIAGFLDGDGSIYVQAKKNDTYRYGYQVAPAIVFFQSAKSEKLFTEFHEFLNLGLMRKRKDGVMEITVGRIAELLQLIEVVKPYTRLKRKQLELLESILVAKAAVEDQRSFSNLLRLIDGYRNLNYSKKRNVLTP
jgi:intein-encoded DNA endonuclease-like protein